MSLKMMKYVGTRVFAVGALLTLATPAQASFIDIGEFNGGTIIWDGDSEVRTMNFNSLELTSIGFGDPTDLFVHMAIQNDFDGLVNFNVRLILSVQNPEQLSAFPPTWVNIVDARSPLSTEELNGNDPALTDDVSRVVGFFGDLGRVGDDFLLSPTQQGDLNLLLATFPTLRFQIGLDVAELELLNNPATDPLIRSLTSCDAAGENCGPINANATFLVTSSTPPQPPQSVPEPATLTLLGAGLASTIFLRRRRVR